METVKLGSLITGDQGRDAIHIAVAPVVAAEKLYPGQHIGFVKDGDYEKVGSGANPIGIVDPYLTSPVYPEQRFFMCLYPQTVTSLRHEWEHPAFKADTCDKGASEVWLRSFAETAELSYEELLDGARDYLDHGKYLIDGGKWEGFNMPHEFWDHYEAVTGRDVPLDDRGGFFSCSC